jgi:putative drug exporter of the RND superfamily
MVRNRRRVLVVGAVLTILGLALAGPIAGRLTATEDLHGIAAYDAGQQIARLYDTGGNNNAIVAVVTLPGHTRVDTSAGASELAGTFAPLEADHALRVAAYPFVSDRALVSPNGRSAMALILPGATPPSATVLAGVLRAHAPRGATVDVTGLTELQGAGSGIGVLGEVVIGSVGALIVLVIVFGSLLAMVPLVIAIGSILTTFLALGALTSVAQVSQLVEYLVSLLGLGIAIDYSLLIVSRWREELDRGASNDQAVVLAMNSAGRAVALSGLAVALGLASLLALPLPFLRSLGYGGLLIPLVTVGAAFTVLPAMLSAWGPRLDRRRRSSRAATKLGRRWARWARGVVRHRVLALLAAAVVLGFLIGAAASLRVGEPAPTSLAGKGPPASTLVGLERSGFPVGTLQPVEVLVPRGADPRVLAGSLAKTHGVFTVLDPSGPSWHRSGTAVLDVVVEAPTSSPQALATEHDIATEVDRLAPGALLAGDGPVEAGLVHAYYSRFPLIVLFVALVSLLALTMAFGSVVLSVKALVLNALSMLAAFGSLVLIWQDGHGSVVIWSIPANGVVVDFVPLVLFAFLFGLTMDYEVFILSRVKEAHDRGLGTDEAVIDGLARTGRLVTSAAVILCLAFAALSAAPIVQIKVFATGMAVGVAIDATVVRSLLVPAVVSLLGDRVWWRPWRHPGTLPTAAPAPSDAGRSAPAGAGGNQPIGPPGLPAGTRVSEVASGWSRHL